MWQYDFNLFYDAGQHVLNGLSPYTIFDFNPPFPFAVLYAPLALLPKWLAYLLFLTLNIVLLWKIMKWKMIWPLLSFPVIFALFVGQVDMLFSMVAMLIGPYAAPLLIAKPQVGFIIGPWLLRKYGWRGLAKAVIIGAVYLVFCFLIRPTWVTDWLSAIPSASKYGIRDSSLFFLLTPEQKMIIPILAIIGLILSLLIKDQKRSWAMASLFQPLSNIYSVSVLATWIGPLEVLLSWLAFLMVGGIHAGAPMFLVALPMFVKWGFEKKSPESKAQSVVLDQPQQ